jgi:hypothetical protein
MESTGYWADTIGKGLEGIRAKMDLGIGPREVTFGNTKSVGVSTIFGTARHHPLLAEPYPAADDFRVRSLLPDERGNITDLSARTFRPSSDDPRRLDGDTWHTLGIQFGTIAEPMQTWSTSAWGGSRQPSHALYHYNKNIPSETMFRDVQRHQNDHPPSAEDISNHIARMRTRTDINRDSGLGKEEILVKTNPLSLTARRPSDNRWSLSDAERVSRMGAFHTGTGGFRFLED